ncbi:MAG: chemotaxis protein CheW [Myxococcales bacterium]|nr:chemotaxis protein CheW [Myxococcales bacterium]
MSASPASVDWAEIHRRLDHAEQALVAAPSEERVLEILRERARALAQGSEAATTAALALRSVLVVGCAGGRYGLDAGLAVELLPLASVTRIPRASPFVAGVSNRRGEVLLLVDLGALLGLSRSGIADLTKVIVVGARGDEVGLLVETVEGIEDVDPSRVAPPVGGAKCITGIVDGSLVLVDLAALLLEHRLSGAVSPPDETLKGPHEKE